MNNIIDFIIISTIFIILLLVIILSLIWSNRKRKQLIINNKIEKIKNKIENLKKEFEEIKKDLIRKINNEELINNEDLNLILSNLKKLYNLKYNINNLITYYKNLNNIINFNSNYKDILSNIHIISYYYSNYKELDNNSITKLLSKYNNYDNDYYYFFKEVSNKIRSYDIDNIENLGPGIKEKIYELYLTGKILYIENNIKTDKIYNFKQELLNI